MKREVSSIDVHYKPFEVLASDGTVHKLRYYVENDCVHLAGTLKKALLQKDGHGHPFDPEGLARLLAQEWLRDKAARSKPARR